MTSPVFPAVMPTYNRAPVLFDHGEGCYLYTENGDKYVDCSAGIATNSLGHCHPALVKTLTDQGNKLWHTANSFVIPNQEKLAQKLVDLTFADTVFFTNSGVEAWECAVKTCRKYQSHIGHPEKWRIITAKHCFHGRSTTAIAAAGSEKMTAGFGPIQDGFDHVPFNDIETLKQAITPETAAINIETIQGEGGITPATQEYLTEVRSLCDQHGLLLFLDEIQCGMGRTGKLYAYEWYDIRPDVICTAKGLGGGFPIGACLATKEAAAGMIVGTHGSTFGGNPLATAVSDTAVSLISQPDFLESVQKNADILFMALHKLQEKHADKIKEIRGKGLMIGIELTEKITNTDFIQKAREVHHLILVAAAQNTIRLLPPLIIDAPVIEDAITRLDSCLSEFA